MSEQEMAALGAQSESEMAAEKGSVEERPVASQRLSRLAIVLSLVSLVAVVISLFLGFHYWNGIQQSLQQLNGSLAQAGRDQSELYEGLSETQSTLQQQQQKLTTQEQAMAEQRLLLEQERDSMRQQGVQLNRSLNAMQQRLGGNTKQWQVAEAEYLMRVASHRLGLMHDPATALGALAAADERLRDTGDPGWSDVREILAEEMNSLRAVPKVDKAGLTASLSALMEQVDKLPLREEGVALNSVELAVVQQGQGESAKGFDLQRIWEDLKEGFKSMMVIRHHQKPIAAMLPPEQGYFLKQNLRLKLEGANTALMVRSVDFYRQSLQASATWVERYFASGSPQVEAFSQQLFQLASEDIAPALPDITASLRALQAHREVLNQRVGE